MADRHVIKGRGVNRGKYLCRAQMAPDVAPTPDGFVWTANQRKACRLDSPRRYATYVTRLDSEHNGYIVKLIASKAIIARVAELKHYIEARANGATKPTPCYWFDDAPFDTFPLYCWECATKVVDEVYAKTPDEFDRVFRPCLDAEDRHNAAICGGYSRDHDSPPMCDVCDAKLEGTLTEYGADQEIAWLIGKGALDPSDSDDWAALNVAISDLENDDPRWRTIAKVVDAAKAQEKASTNELPSF